MPARPSFALYRLVSVSVADETFSAKLATLKDVAMNPIEEEESELLPQVVGEIERQVSEELGAPTTHRRCETRCRSQTCRGEEFAPNPRHKRPAIQTLAKPLALCSFS